MASLIAKLIAFLEDRAGLGAVMALLRHKQVPVHRHTIWYYTGGFTLFLFGVQVATGILLLLYYRPTSAEAFESIQFIVTRVPFGWLIRSIHSWSANLMVLSVQLHLVAVLFLKAYRPPRELTWVGGMVLLFITMTFGFSGYLLPWNELAFFATRVGTDIPAAIPVVGPFVVKLMRGGAEVTGATLTRFFGLHVAILPLLTTALLGMHLALIQKHGMSVPPSIQKEADAGRPLRSISFYPNFALREMMAWLVAVAILAGLAAFAPWELGVKADPFASAPAGIKPEWYFLWMFQAFKLLPAHILGLEGEMVGVMGVSLIAVLLLVLPFIDRSAKDSFRSRLINAVAILGLVFVVGMTWWAYGAAQGRTP